MSGGTLLLFLCLLRGSRLETVQAGCFQSRSHGNYTLPFGHQKRALHLKNILSPPAYPFVPAYCREYSTTTEPMDDIHSSSRMLSHFPAAHPSSVRCTLARKIHGGLADVAQAFEMA
jgi:hypothetical protein